MASRSARRSTPSARSARRRNRGRQRRAGALLRLLVVGGVRVDGDVRRGVPRPQADHPARHHAQRRRHRPVLRVRLVDGDRGNRSAAVRRARAGRRHRRRHLLRARPRSTTATGRSRCSTSCCAPGRSPAAWRSTTARRATSMRLAARAFRRGCRRHSARRIPSTARRTSRRSCRPASRWSSSWRSSPPAWIRTCTCTRCWRFSGPWRS